MAGTQTITHLFFTCRSTSGFLTQLCTFLETLNVALNLSIKKVLFGDPTKGSMSFENMMILYIKGFTWQCKLKSTTPTLRGFKSYLKCLLSTLKYVYTILKVENVFEQNWHILYDHLLQE